jgi:phage terminase large subunit
MASGTVRVRLPYNFEPRFYQLPLLESLDNGKKRAIIVWHRRAGKEKASVNIMAKRMYERVGNYYYYFPTFTQGKKILWEGMDKSGFKFLDHFPKHLLKKKPNDTEMKIEYSNGSIFRIIGTDKYDSLVGPNPVGCVFSEYSLQDPMGWDLVRPILAENDGWALFNFTPRGENHGYQLLEMAKNDPAWFTQILTVDDTGVIPRDVLDQERREIIAKDGNDALYQQEYYCSFKVPIAGAYYAAQIMKANEEKRITSIPYERVIPVDTWWDLGIDDSMTIWFTQTVGKEIRFIDYYETSGEGLVHCAGMLKEKGYVYGTHTAPHDIEVRELTTGKSRRETAKNFGINFDVVPAGNIEDGIDAARNIFSKCWFDDKKCNRGLNALKSYHKDYDEKNLTYRVHPVHDWSSHGADAFRTFAVGYKDRSYGQRVDVVTPDWQNKKRWGK